MPLKTALQHEKASEEAEISLLLCDDPFIRQLNKTYRGIDQPTDVLSFAQQDQHLLGDIVISLETASRQAETACWPVENEITLLAIHGLLHLLGYDDETAEEAAQMRDLAASALHASGIALPDEKKHPFFARFEDEN